MAGFIPEYIIDEIRTKADIVEVISAYVNLKQAGRIFKGLCPFHSEKTPSFTVNPERQIFHCFGCGVGGNVFRFLTLQKGVTFPEAVEELAERYAVEIPRQTASVQPAGESKTDLYQAVALAQGFYENQLHGSGGQEARDYLKNRGFGPDIIRGFRLGWAPPGWDNLHNFLKSRRVGAQVMAAAGLIKSGQNERKFYDAFRARIIFPIPDLAGKTVAFGGRLIREEENQPKYLNSPETPIYQKGKLLYGFDRARPSFKLKKSVVIVEGYLDLLALVANKVTNVVATLGTALTPAHLRLLKGYLDEAVIVFDPDEAGRSAAARALPLFMSADLDGRVLKLPEDHDPDTFIQTFGQDEFERLLAQSVDLFDFFLEQLIAAQPRTLAGKSRAAEAALEVIAQVHGRTRQELLRRKLAEKLGLPEQVLRVPDRRVRPDVYKTGDGVSALAVDVEINFLKLILLHPESWAMVFAEDLRLLFTGEAASEIFAFMYNQYQQNREIDLARLISGIKPEQVDLVSGLAMSEDGVEDENLGLAVADYIKQFKSRGLKWRAEELSRKIKQAHEAADEAALSRLMAEQNCLLKSKTL